LLQVVFEGQMNINNANKLGNLGSAIQFSRFHSFRLIILRPVRLTAKVFGQECKFRYFFYNFFKKFYTYKYLASYVRQYHVDVHV
jgi:hypothetical protein